MTTKNDTGTLTLQDGEMLEITGDPLLQPFCVGVPHQRRAFLTYPEALPPNEEDGDRLIEGDHDLHGCHLIETLEDARPLLDWMDGRGGQSRHQAIAIANIVKSELIEQGVLAEIDDDE